MCCIPILLQTTFSENLWVMQESSSTKNPPKGQSGRIITRKFPIGWSWFRVIARFTKIEMRKSFQNTTKYVLIKVEYLSMISIVKMSKQPKKVQLQNVKYVFTPSELLEASYIALARYVQIQIQIWVGPNFLWLDYGWHDGVGDDDNDCSRLKNHRT